MAVALLAVYPCFAAPASGQQAEKPNIVILVADDLGWKDVGFHGAGFKTPQIDRIAREGVKLWRFCGSPVCSLTRVALVTGRHPIRYRLQQSTIKPWTDLGIPSQEQTLAELLEQAGYRRRGVSGKWHLGGSKKFHPLKQGSSHFIGHYGGAIDYFRHLRLGALDWHHGFNLSREQGFSSELLGGHAARFVRETPIGEPFFLYVPFNAIHGPNHVTREHLRRNADMEPENRRLKAARMTAMDDAVYRILKALEDRQETDSTLVPFSATMAASRRRGRATSLCLAGSTLSTKAESVVPRLRDGRVAESPADTESNRRCQGSTCSRRSHGSAA